MRLHQTPSRPAHAGCNRFVILEDVHNSCAVRCRAGGHFFRFEASGCPLPTTAPRRRSPGAQAPYGQPRHRVLPFQVSRTICGPAPAQRDDGDRHALPGRHRRSQAATTPAVVTAWQATCACVPPMASVCCAPDASTLWCSCGSILRGGHFSNASVNLLFTI